MMRRAILFHALRQLGEQDRTLALAAHKPRVCEQVRQNNRRRVRLINRLYTA